MGALQPQCTACIFNYSSVILSLERILLITRIRKLIFLSVHVCNNAYDRTKHVLVTKPHDTGD
jgi:hypothetical protein